MPTQYTPEEYPLWSYDKMMSSPAFEDHETVIGPRTDDWTQYSWTLDASYSGQRIYALPDAGIFSYSPSVTFPEDTKFLENRAWVTVVQPYVWYAHDGSVFQKGFAYVFDGHSGDPGKEVYDQYGLPYNYVDVGALYEDWHSALPGSNEWVDYADHYVLLAGSLSAGFDQYLAGQDARILVTTFGPNSRDGAWGPNWLNHYYYDGSPPQSETDPFATHIDSFSTIYGSILAALEGIPKVAQAREIAGQYLDLDAQIRMDGATLGNPTFAPFAGRDAAFDEFRATSIGASDDNPTVKKALGFAGKLLTAADVGATIVNNYQQTGGNYSKTIQAGGVKLLAALVSGELGTLAGTGAAAFLVSAVGAPIAATGLATIAGIAVGVGVGYVVDKGVTIGANWLIDQAFPDHGALARAAGDKPAWSYNVDTGKFKWLDSKVEAKCGQYLTLLDVNPKPVGLKLKGDLYADKDDFLLGHGGKDTMSSGNGNDILYGAGNSDSISSGNGTDIIYGDKGNDTILGGAGADTIFGGAGNDRILGGKGSDALTGEAGKDRFVFQSVAEIGKGALGDTIYDFTRGKDKIDLSAIDADPRKAGNQAFKWSKLTKTFVEDDWKGHLLVEGDLNKDGQPDFTLKLVGISAVSASDFIL